MKAPGLEVDDPRQAIRLLATLLEALPAPAEVTNEEMQAALSIYEKIVTANERVALVLVAVESSRREMNLLLTIVVLMRHLEKKLQLSFEEVMRLISKRRTIVGLALGG